MVLFQHNIESQIWKRLADTAGNAVKRAYLASQYRRMWRAEKELSEGFEGIITVSPEDSAFCREQYQLRRVLGDVPTGVDVDAFQPPAGPAAAPVIGFLGSMMGIGGGFLLAQPGPAGAVRASATQLTVCSPIGYAISSRSAP